MAHFMEGESKKYQMKGEKIWQFPSGLGIFIFNCFNLILGGRASSCPIPN